MIFGQETETIEFKKTTGETKEAVVSIASILNKHGKGEVYFGIKNDGEVLGQQIGDATLRDVSKAISDNLKPQIFPTVDAVTIDDKRCVRVVFGGSNPPYYAFGRAFIRVADEDKQMSPEELESFIIRKYENVSNWDSSLSRTNIGDIDETALERYVDKANKAGRLDYEYTDKRDILSRLKLTDGDFLCNAANVMFGEDPGTEVQMATFATEEKLTFNDINRKSGRVLDLVDAAERYIRNTMRYRVVIDGSQLERKEIPEVPHVAIREALLNSFCHKDYRAPQNNEVAIFSNRIEIYNPGTFPEGVSPDDFIKGKGHTVHRNPLLARIMYYSKDIESFGTGLKRIADNCDAAGVKYEFVTDNLGFTVVFYRPPLWASDKEQAVVPSGRKRSQTADSNGRKRSQAVGPSGRKRSQAVAAGDRKQVVLSELEKHGQIATPDAAEILGMSVGRVRALFREMVSDGSIEKVGDNRYTYYIPKPQAGMSRAGD